MLTNGKGPAEALRPGPTTTCLLTYHCLLLMDDETTETGETRESSETSENSENIVSDRIGRGSPAWAYLGRGDRNRRRENLGIAKRGEGV